jgi:hypothetical protein
MGTSIFIKTWKNDLQWLKYCMDSIRKYCSGFDEIVIASDAGCADAVRVFCPDARVESVKEWGNGYIQQQWVKLCADKLINGEQILFVDSDCIFHTPFTPEDFMKDGKPILLKILYSELAKCPLGSKALHWRKVTEDVVKWNVEWEYMRRCPMMFLSSTVRETREMFPWLEEYLRQLKSQKFSEFNVLGAVVENIEPENYSIIDAHDYLPPCPAKQFRSWDGISHEIQLEIEGFLK